MAIDELKSRTWAVGALALCGALLAPVVAFRFGQDQGTLAYVGSEWLQGHWPYLDTWDHDLPGMMLLHAAVIGLFGKSMAAFRLFDGCFQLACAGVILGVTRALSDRRGALLAGALYSVTYASLGPWETGQRDGYAALFALSGFWLFLTRARRHPALTAGAIGLGLGTAFLFKPTTLALAALYVPAIRARRDRSWRFVALALAAAALPLAATAVIFAARGALDELWDACVRFNLAIHAHVARMPADRLADWLGRLPNLGVRAWLVALAGGLAVARRPGDSPRRMVFAGYLGALASVLVQGKMYPYHYLPALALGSILLGILGSDLISAARQLAERRAGSRFTAVTSWILPALLVVLVFGVARPASYRSLVSLRFLGAPGPGEFRHGESFDVAESWALASFLSTNTKTDETVQVWGADSLVYYLAGRRAASRFQSTYPLLARGERHQLSALQSRWREEFLARVRAAPPLYWVVVRGKARWWTPDGKDFEQLLTEFPELDRFVSEHYEFDRAIGRFAVFRRRS